MRSRACKLTDRRTNETASVSFIAYSASGTIRVGGFCLELRAESRIRSGKDGEASTRREGSMTRAIGLRKKKERRVSPSTELQNIVLRRFIGFVSGGSPEGPDSYDVGQEGEGKGERR